MKIALLGYGKMGKAIEQIALADGHEIVLKLSTANLHELTKENISSADVAIEFSRPETAFRNVSFCIENGVPVVSGTTAWLDQMGEAKKICMEKQGAFFYASNYSIGVNIFFAVNKYLAKLMENQSQYDVEMKEVHHLQKLDHPSGTAITLAEGIISNLTRKKEWAGALEENSQVDRSFAPETLGIVSYREENVPGSHFVKWGNEIDSIEISHVAHSRQGFASGALLAAKWLVGKTGVYGMEDMLGF